MVSQALLCDQFLKTYDKIIFGLGEWREYKEGVWEAVPDLVVKRHVQAIIRANSRKELSSMLVASVMDLIKPLVYVPADLFNSNSSVLTFKNCCLNLNTFKTVPHSSNNYFTNKLNYDYDPTVQSRAWNEAAKSFPHAEFLREFAGLCLTPETKYEIAVWLYGPPGGGKSTFISGVETALGPKVCTLGLHEMETSPFALSQLPGKTLAVSTEQPSQFIKCSHLLNKIISGEPVQINQKFLPAYDMNPRVKLLWAVNELPTIPGGPGAGLFRRVYPVKWPALDEALRDPNIKEEIINSPMGTVNWILPGLQRLRQRGCFDIPTELKAARDAYKIQSDTMQCFVEDCCDVNDSAEVKSSQLYETYRKWSENNGHKGTLASNRFAGEMERLGFLKTRRAIGVYWSGLELKVDFPDLLVTD